MESVLSPDLGLLEHEKKHVVLLRQLYFVRGA